MLKQVHIAEYFDASGQKIRLGNKLGEGGEGAVYEILGHYDLVAKIYHKEISAGKAIKLDIMARGKSEKLLQLSSWPVETLYERPGGEMLGIIMPRISGYKPVHELYSPRSRRSEFPHANWPFLLHAAANVARAFAVMHEHGHIIGDVNHGNVVVSSNALVKLIDCDSFQIRGRQQTFYCEVGVPEYTPPELHGRDFSKTFRTANHDNFGLAVLLFHLLFMGRHPFAGRYLGPDYMPIDRAIREYRFVYGKGGLLKQMQPPPNTLPLEFVSPPIAQLFERAFAKSALDNNSRPKAEEWVKALSQLAAEVKTCSRSEAHAFYGGLSSCPWCEMERKLGVDLFVITRPVNQALPFELGAVWSRIVQVASPGNASLPPLPVVQPSALVKSTAWRSKYGAPALGLVAAIIAMIIPYALDLNLLSGIVPVVLIFIGVYSYRKNIAEKFVNTHLDAAAHLRAIEQEWEKMASEAPFLKAFRGLEKVRKEYLELPQLRAQEHAKLKNKLKEHQLEHFLERFRIKDAKIENIGRERVSMLLSYGIETAADVSMTRLKKVPGFGKVLINRLRDWRADMEKHFVFNPYKDVDPRDIARVDREINEKRRQLEISLTNGPAQLAQIRDEIMIARQRILSRLVQAQSALAQAEADRQFIS